MFDFLAFSMALTGVTGVPGSGKSLLSIKQYFIPALQVGRHVYHNIEGLSVEGLAECSGISDIKVAHLVHLIDPLECDWEKFEQNGFIIIDEAQNTFGVGMASQSHFVRFMKYLTRHRHYGHDIVIVTQSIDNITAQVRRILDSLFRLYPLKNMGVGSGYRYVRYEGDCIDKDKIIGTGQGLYDRKLFVCYDSYVSASVTEDKKSNLNFLLGNWQIRIIVGITLFLVLASLFLWKKNGGIKTIKGAKNETEISGELLDATQGQNSTSIHCFEFNSITWCKGSDGKYKPE